MNKEIGLKWVEALRSGKYKQARKVLCTFEGTMCCLGVLRHIMDPNDDREMKGKQLLSTSQLRRAGLHRHTQVVLASMNDEGHTFNQIADRIEKYILRRKA